MGVRWRALFMGCVLSLSACGDQKPTIDVSALRVTGQQPQLEVHFARPSPDGERMLYYYEQGCVRRLNGSGEHCIDRMDALVAAWSPDGKRVAFTESPYEREPDLWVLDVESGEAHNLTDDGVDRSGVADEFPDNAVIDILPSFTPNGEQIRFARKRDAATIDLVSIPVAGGEVTRIRSIPGRLDELAGLAWTGNTVAWALGEDDTEVRLAGVLSSEGKVVLRGGYANLSFSPDGEYLLASPWGGTSRGTDRSRVVPVAGGEPMAVAPGVVAYPTWAPQGHALAFLNARRELRVVGEPGGEPETLRVDGELDAAGPALSWVPGKLLLIVDDQPTVLTVTE